MNSKKNVVYTLFFLLLLFVLLNVDIKVYAKTCIYYQKYHQNISGPKLMEAGSSSLDSKLELTINEDSTTDVKTYGNGTFGSGSEDKVKKKGNLENWGQDADNIPDIKADTCPKYVGEVPGVKNKFYGFNDEIINTSSYKLAEKASDSTLHIYVLNNDPDQGSSIINEQYFTCTYESFHIDFEKESFKGVQANSNEVNVALPTTYELKDEITLKDTNDKLVCPVVYVYFSTSIGGTTAHGQIYYNSIDFSSDHPNEQYERYVCVSGEYCDPNSEESNTCEPYTTAVESIHEYQKLYSETGLPEYNEFIRTKYDSLTNLCGEIINHVNFDDGCLQRCLKLHDDVNLYGDVNKDKCGISNNLIVWILNIVKWAKYIIPIIVILMGILDFMRAVASDKDDAMKKAQGRFVKRLIAAALIFIVPFILEFILEKMGFGIDGCRVSDWWS